MSFPRLDRLVCVSVCLWENEAAPGARTRRLVAGKGKDGAGANAERLGRTRKRRQPSSSGGAKRERKERERKEWELFVQSSQNGDKGEEKRKPHAETDTQRNDRGINVCSSLIERLQQRREDGLGGALPLSLLVPGPGDLSAQTCHDASAEGDHRQEDVGHVGR